MSRHTRGASIFDGITAPGDSPFRGFPMRFLLPLALLAALFALPVPAPAADPPKLRIIVFGAHPDDAELKAGGTAAKWAKAGHAVKMVSVTNGDIGHWREAG